MSLPPSALLIEVAAGRRPADLLLRNARLINLFSGAVEHTDIAVCGGFVAGLGAYAAEQVIDLQGGLVAPGFIDAHVHIESAMLDPAGFAAAVLPHGTTAVIADPHEIANVLGTAGLDYMLVRSENLPLHFYFALPSCVPATEMENSGARLTAADLAAYAGHPRIAALAEVMNFPGVLAGDSGVLAKIAMAREAGKVIDGHAPGLGGRSLQAYLASGVGSDHECTTLAEAREKLSAGMRIMIREGTGARNLDALLPLATAVNARRLMWCTDDRHPQDLLCEGHIDSMVARAVRAGLDPITAIQMATLNTAEYFRLDQLGAVAPGRRADLVVLENLRDPVVRQVYCAGLLQAQDGRLVGSGFETQGGGPLGSVKIPLERLSFKIPAAGRRVRAIAALPDQIVTGSEVVPARIVQGCAEADPARDLLKVAVVERHHGSGRTGLGFIRGFGLKSGAIASTVAHDSHNLIVAGVDDGDMHAAAAELVDLNGGLVVVEKGCVTARMALPIAGLMSDQPLARVAACLEDLLKAARRLGATLPDPFMTLSFMALPVIPALKITDHGLVDVEAFKEVPLFVED